MLTSVHVLPKSIPISNGSLRRCASLVAEAAAARASARDADGAFPDEEIADLADKGLLRAPLPPALGGADLGWSSDPLLLMDVLSTIGAGSLSLGRLFEGHVNAVKLVRLYGSPANLAILAAEIDAGRLGGVWMAEDADPLLLDEHFGRRLLKGRKILASGAGHVRRPLVAARTAEGSRMALPYVDDAARVDTSAWVTHGMRATATGTVDFSGIMLSAEEMVGAPGDYLRSPYFSGGAWRVLAVQLGGVEAIMRAYAGQIKASGRDDDRLQRMRFAEALRAAETARLWVREACIRAEGETIPPEDIDAYVDLARNAVTEAALVVIDRAEKAIGLRAFLRENPLERLIRDLSTYLRQPALDMSSEAAAAHSFGRENTDV